MSDHRIHVLSISVDDETNETLTWEKIFKALEDVGFDHIRQHDAYTVDEEQYIKIEVIHPDK